MKLYKNGKKKTMRSSNREDSMLVLYIVYFELKENKTNMFKQVLKSLLTCSNKCGIK